MRLAEVGKLVWSRSFLQAKLQGTKWAELEVTNMAIIITIFLQFYINAIAKVMKRVLLRSF